MRSELIQFNFLDRRSINTGTDRYTSSLSLCSATAPKATKMDLFFVEGCRSIVRLFDRLNFHMKDPIDLFYFFVIMEYMYARGALYYQRWRRRRRTPSLTSNRL